MCERDSARGVGKFSAEGCALTLKSTRRNRRRTPSNRSGLNYAVACRQRVVAHCQPSVTCECVCLCVYMYVWKHRVVWEASRIHISTRVPPSAICQAKMRYDDTATTTSTSTPRRWLTGPAHRMFSTTLSVHVDFGRMRRLNSV